MIWPLDPSSCFSGARLKAPASSIPSKASFGHKYACYITHWHICNRWVTEIKVNNCKIPFRGHQLSGEENDGRTARGVTSILNFVIKLTFWTDAEHRSEVQPSSNYRLAFLWGEHIMWKAHLPTSIENQCRFTPAVRLSAAYWCMRAYVIRVTHCCMRRAYVSHCIVRMNRLLHFPNKTRCLTMQNLLPGCQCGRRLPGQRCVVAKVFWMTFSALLCGCGNNLFR